MTDFNKIGKKSKRKGNSYERKIAKILLNYTGINFRRVPSSGGFNRQGVEIAKEYFCGDLVCDNNKFLYCIEAKNRLGFDFCQILKNPNTAVFTEWWFKAVREAKDAKLLPLMFIHLPGGHEVIAITHSDHDFLCNGMILEIYNNSVLFHLKEKAKGESKVRKHYVEAKLPVPYIISWNHLAEIKSFEFMFGDRKKLKADYGEIVVYD